MIDLNNPFDLAGVVLFVYIAIIVFFVMIFDAFYARKKRKNIFLGLFTGFIFGFTFSMVSLSFLMFYYSN